MKIRHLWAVAALAAVLLGGASAFATPAAARSSHCFFSRDFQGWKAADSKTLYIRVGASRYYRLDLTSCPAVTWQSAYLITKFRGSTTICRAVDWDLHVATSRTYSTACIVKGMSELTKAEVDALPKRFKP